MLVNRLGEESSSEPRYVFVRPVEPPLRHDVVDAWLQPRSLDARAIHTASRDVPYVDADSYHAAVSAIERPLVEAAVDDPANRAVAQALIDGNLVVNATGPAAPPPA